MSVLRMLRGGACPGAVGGGFEPEEGKDDSRYSCQRMLGGVEITAKMANCMTGIQSMLKDVLLVYAVRAWAMMFDIADITAACTVIDTIGEPAILL